MLIPAVPILLSIDSILILWLKEVPLFTKQFTILLILNGLIGITTSGFDAAVQATGKIRKMHIWYSIILLSSLPISYLLFKLHYPPYIITVLYMSSSIIYRFVQVKILTQVSEFNTSKYINHTIIPTLLVSIVTLPQIFLRNLFGQDISSILIFSTLSICIILT